MDTETLGRKQMGAEDRGAMPAAGALMLAARGNGEGRSRGLPGCGSSVTPRRLADHPVCGEAAPVWLAALIAARCRAHGLEMAHEVSWLAIAGRAIYTNFGSHDESIEPLGVNLPAGDTLAVSWSPGDTGYTVEIYSESEKCA